MKPERPTLKRHAVEVDADRARCSCGDFISLTGTPEQREEAAAWFRTKHPEDAR